MNQVAADTNCRPVTTGAPLVGRTAERAELTTLIERATHERPRHVIVRGVAGSGKTTLLAWTVEQARQRRFRVVEVSLHDGGLPLAALRAALPDPAVDAPHSDVADRWRDLLERWALERPVLLAIDNLDAADRATRNAVLYLMRHLRHRRVLIAVTCCDERLTAELADHLRRLVDGGRADELTLDMLSEGDLSELTGMRSGTPPHPEFVRALRDRTGGLPFFAVELLDVLLAAGVEPSSALLSTRVTELTLPRRVTTAVLHRVFELGPDARVVASALAVLGATALDRLAVVSEMTGLDPTHTQDVFDRLVRARVLVPDGAVFRFGHSIVRDALYADMDPAVRRRRHGHAASLLEHRRPAARPDAILEIAEHLRRGPGGRDPVAARLLREAGDAVLDEDPGAAAAWYRDALARSEPTSPDVPALQLALGQALDLGGHHDDAMRLTAAVLDRLGPGPERARAAWAAAQAAVASGHLDRASSFVDSALVAADGTASSRLLVQRGWVRLWQGHLGPAAEDLTDARALGVADAEPHADALEMHVCLARGDTTRAAVLAARLRRRLDDIDPPDRAGVRLALRVADAFELDPGLAAADAHEADARSGTAGWHHALVAYALWRQGRLDDARHTIERAAVTAGDDPAELTTSLVLAVQLWTRVEEGDLAGAEDICRLARSRPPVVMPWLVECATARLHVAKGEPALAVAVLQDAVQRAGDSGRVDALTMTSAALVEAAVAAGQVGEARAANSRLQALPDDGASVAATMNRTLSHAIAERDLDAARAARDHAVRHDLRLDAARAAALVGHLDGDREQLLVAQDEFAALGALTRQRDTARLGRGQRSRAATRRGRGGMLSDADRVIAHLVAEGLTNRQIARRMSFSPKTIEVYLSRIYAKTGCRSRVELAVAVQRDALVDLRPPVATGS